MVKFLTAVFAILLVLPVLRAESVVPGDGASPQNRYIFYKATRGEATFYILGAMHIGKADAPPYTPAIYEALAKSQKLIFESEVRRDKVRMELAQAMYLPDGVTLEKYLTKQDTELLKKFCDRIGVSVATLNRFQPWLIEIMAAYRIGFMKGYVIEHGTEHTLLRYVEQKLLKEERPGIMTLEGQDEVFRRMSKVALADQIARLRVILPYYIAADFKAVEDLVEMWRRGDTDAMWKLYSQQKDPSPQTARFFELLLFERNRIMADRIEIIARYPGTYFVVPGAMHLIGERSILKYLEKAGFTVERL